MGIFARGLRRVPASAALPSGVGRSMSRSARQLTACTRVAYTAPSQVHVARIVLQLLGAIVLFLLAFRVAVAAAANHAPSTRID